MLQQCDAPRALYDAPVNAFVAGFIGSPAMNMFTATVDDGGVRIGAATLEVPEGVPAPTGSTVTVGLRPEALELASHGLPGVVNLVEELGSESYVYAELAGGAEAPVTASTKFIVRVPPNQAPAKGTAIHVAAKPGSMLFFEPKSGERIVRRPA